MVRAAYLYGRLYAARGIVHPKSRVESSKRFKCSAAPSSESTLRRPSNLRIRIAAGLRILQAYLNRPQTFVGAQQNDVGDRASHFTVARAHDLYRARGQQAPSAFIQRTSSP